MSKRILIIDNEAFIQEIAKIALETVAGWQILTADSGLAGIHIATTAQPDAILLDVMMPDMDGLTTFEKLRNTPATQSIPVILLTAKVQPTDQRHYEKIGIAATIAKPFDPLALAHQIATILDWHEIT
jgi:CheY-like chemotaxis protein